MNKRVSEVIESGRQLTSQERDEVVRALLEVDDHAAVAPDAAALERSWAVEGKRRAAQIDTGEVALVPWKDVLDELRDK